MENDPLFKLTGGSKIRNIKTDTTHFVESIDEYGDVTLVFTTDCQYFDVRDVIVVPHLVFLEYLFCDHESPSLEKEIDEYIHSPNPFLYIRNPPITLKDIMREHKEKERLESRQKKWYYKLFKFLKKLFSRENPANV